jgi:hypothetical protein
MEEFERLELQAERSEDSGSGKADDAPAELESVMQRIARGELDLDAVVSGEVSDPDARRVHLWMDARLETLRRAWELMEQGMRADEALERAQEGGRR